MSSLPNNTFASPGNAYYATRGEIIGAQDWYQYPSQNGEIQLIDSSGTQLLQSIGGDLFYNNELLAKANDIQDIADWSLYPALSNVNMNGQSLTDVSSIVVNNNINTNSLLVTNGITSQANIVTATLQVAGEPIPALGQITTKTLASSGAVQAGSLATTGGLDMTNSSITRASSVGISNSGFAPYGSLTSPDGVQLTWNGAAITTGAGGNASQWANYPAVATINANTNNITNAGTLSATGNITTAANVTASNVVANLHTQIYDTSNNPPMRLTALNPSGLLITSTNGGIASVASAGNIEATASGNMSNVAANIANSVSNNYSITADTGINILTAANVDITAQNGSGGNIALNAQPGYQLGGQQVGFGAIQLNAFGSTNQVLGLGGKIDINAYSGGLGEYGSATSRVSVSSATIALSAGAVPPLPATAGSMNIFGQDIVSIVASLVPPVLPQFPNSVFIYGDGVPGVAGGVRLSSPQGVQIAGNSDLYATDVYPFTSLGLNLKGRASIPGPAADVTISDCASIAMRNAGTITGVVSINGVAYPPPAGLVEDWSTYVAVSAVDLSGQGINRVGDLSGVGLINGSVYPPVVSSADWATFPAIQNVDISGFSVNAVGNINTVAGAAITSAGALSIFADTSGGNLSIATNGGGDVNIGTGNAGDINITTSGAGNEVTIGGDVVNLTATAGVRVSALLDVEANNIYNVATLRGSLATDLTIIADGTGNLNQEGTIITLTAPTKVTLDTPIIDVVGADIQNVSNITNEATNLLTVQSTVNLTVSAETALTLVSDSADVTVQGQTGVSVYAATGDVSLTADSGEVIVQDSVLNMNTHKITNLTNGTAAADAVNYGQLTFRDSTEFYVSGQGSDSNNGSILAPFLTIQAAITAAELISSASSICSINVASGNYPQSLTFNKGYIVLNGTLQSQTGNEVCEITGSITINCTGANDVFNRQVAFQGFNITCGAGQSITNTSASSHTVSFQDCKIFVNSVCYNSTATCADARTYFTNVEISSTNAANVSPVITTNVGLVELERLDLNVDGNAIGLLIGGTSVLSRFSLSTLENTNTGATLLPLLSFTSTTNSPHSLGNVAFAFTAANAKTNTNAVYINSGVSTAIIALNNVFTLAGTASSTNNCIGYSGVGSPTIAGVNNTSLNINVLLPQTVSVQSGITQIQYTNIQPPGLACYSSTADQPIAVTGTPQALTYNTTQFNQGTTLLLNSRVYANAQGNYALSYSVELFHTGGGITQTATTFLKKNGTTIANTGRQWSIASGGFQNAAMAEFVVSLNAGDYVEVFFSGDTSLSANATAAAGALPAIPSVVFNIKQFR